MSEFEREQIVKALDSCTRGRKSKDDRPCHECPYNECNLVGGTSERQSKGTCQGWLMKDALSLIKELKDEKNEVFEKGCENLTRLEEAYLKLESENLKLTEQNAKLLNELKGAPINNSEWEILYKGLLQSYKMLTEENERLRAELKESEEEYEHVYEQAEADIRGNIADGGTSCHWCIAGHKADTVRKMQSEIEKRCGDGGIYPAFVASTIDQIAKEMLEDEK